MGPLIDSAAVHNMQEALLTIKEQGGSVLFGGSILESSEYLSPCYVEACLVEANKDMPILQHEVFAPILYLIPYKGDISQAIQIQNNSKHGLSSALFSESLKDSEQFLSHWGSDCGIANINIGT